MPTSKAHPHHAPGTVETTGRPAYRRDPALAGPAPRRGLPGATGCHRKARRTTNADAYVAANSGTTRLIMVQGEIDLSTADALYRRLKTLAGPPPHRITLDLSQVDFIDCAGLHALDAMARAARNGGGRMRIGAKSSAAARLFELAGWPGWK